MARTVRNAKLGSRSARASSGLKQRKSPYWTAISPGFALGYRKAPKGGVWVAKLVKPGFRQETTLGPADDALDPDGLYVLSYAQAQEKARDWKKKVEVNESGGGPNQPVTIREAVDSYEADLKARGGDTGNVGRLRAHLADDLLDEMVPFLTWTQLRKWRDGLIRTSAKKRKATSEPMSIDSIKPQPTAAQKLSPATINRTCAAFKAALNHVANGSDQHVVNSLAWEKGLELIPDAQQARNVILPDAAVLQIAANAYTPEAEFGLFVEVAAVTGARPGQIRRLIVADLQADHTNPRLMMPSSRKGKNGLTKASHHPVPITADLSKRLQDGAAGRPPTAPLLMKPDGGPWKKSDQGRRFDRVVKQCGLANWKQPGYPEKITIYALRHSDIVRQIRANVPLRIIAATHDTSVAMIERHYSRYIADHTDAISRAALLDMSKPITEHQIGSR